MQRLSRLLEPHAAHVYNLLHAAACPSAACRPEPIAAASLGQVYKGTLRSTGEAVAVKVQRPG